MVIWEENHDYSAIIGNPEAPEVNALAKTCGLALDYGSLKHPSLPNYLEMTSGRRYSSWPWVNDCDPVGSCTTSTPSIFSDLVAHGHQWRAYAESMAGNCGLVSYGSYAARHNPAVYYTSVRNQCRSWDQPLGTPQHGPLHVALVRGPAVALTTVTPDVNDDMHNGTVAEADPWLKMWVPEIVASPSYRAGRLAVLLVWDEGSGAGSKTSHVPLIVMSASTPAGARSKLSYNDFSVLRALCELTRVPDLGAAASAPSLVQPFNL